MIVASLCLGTVLRLGNYGFFSANLTGHYNFIDTDCYYQLRRLVYFLANFPRTLIFDPLSDWPTGSRVDWPDGFVYIIGLPLKLLGVSDFRSLEMGACLVMIALGLLTCLSIYFLAKRLLKDSSMALFVFFIACINFLLVRFSCLGELDHHILEAFFPIVMLLLSLKAFQDQKLWASCLLGLTMTLFLWVSSSSVFAIGLFFILYAFILSKPKDTRLFLIMMSAFGISLAPLVAYHYKSFGSFKLLTHPSMFHLILISVFAGVSFWISRSGRKAILILTGAVGIFLIFYLLRIPSVLMEPLSWAISYVFGHAGPLQNVSEASPIYMNFSDLSLNFMHSNFGYFVYLLPLVWILIFRLKKFSTEDRVLILSLALLAIPGVFQKRFCQIMIGVFLIYLGWCLKKVHGFLKSKEMRIAPAISLLFLCFSVFPGLKYGFYPEGSPRDRVDQGIAHLFLRESHLNDESVWDRLALKKPSTEGILANPNLGHLLQYLTGYGVVTNSFYHMNGFDLDFNIRQTKTDEGYRDILRQNKIRYIILVDDFRFLEFQYELHGLSKSKVVEVKMMNGQLSTIFQMEELMKYAWVRWFTAEGQVDQFTPLFRASFLEDYFYKNAVAYRFDGL